MLSTFICMLFYIKILHYPSFRLDVHLNHFYIVANIRFNLIYPYDSGCFQFSISISKVINIFVYIYIIGFISMGATKVGLLDQKLVFNLFISIDTARF